jgi:foldase protein PrsA
MYRWIKILPAAACVACGGCGGAGGGEAIGGARAIAVGSLSIRASDAHTLIARAAITEKVEVPDAPAYSRCMTRLARRPAQRRLTAAKLRQQCSRRDSALKALALSRWIDDAWEIAEAEQQNVGVSEDQAIARLGVLRKTVYPTQKGFDDLLRNTHQSVAELIFDVRAELAQQRLLRRLNTEALSFARRARYFRLHEAAFQRQQRRDLRVIRTTAFSLASLAMTALNAHQAFLGVAERFSRPKVRHATEAEARDVERGSLDRSVAKTVFSARPGRFYGPVKDGRAFYIFEVVKIIPAEHRALGDVEREEDSVLAAGTRKEALGRFLATWRARWAARTLCRPGFVIPKCSEYHGLVKVTDPYTFS